jgi:hypothetical protein
MREPTFPVDRLGAADVDYLTEARAVAQHRVQIVT